VINRLWLVAVVERLSAAVLAYRMIYRSEVAAADVAAVIRDALSVRWEPKPLTIKTLSYPKDGGFPSGVIPETDGAVWSVTLLDGALAHLSESIHSVVRKTTGFVVNWGPPGHFERRATVERTFKTIEEELFHRFPSTTGSGPDRNRASDALEAAKKFRIKVKEVDELLDVVFAGHNGRPNERNSFNSALDTIRYFVAGPYPKTMLRKLPRFSTVQAKLFARIEKRTVRGRLSSGRRPYVQIDHVHYTSPVLAQAIGLVGTQLTVHIDDDDMRQVTAFLPNGAEIGVLTACGRWSLTKHDRRTRKAIFSLAAKGILFLSENTDPVRAYFAHLSATLKEARAESKESRQQATELARVMRESSIDGGNIREASSENSESSPRRKVPPLLRPVPDTVYKVKNR
jgi:putative transposase